LIDGKPIREYPIQQLRRAIGFVPQETFLFSDTLAENIAFGVEGDPPRRRGDAENMLAVDGNEPAEPARDHSVHSSSASLRLGGETISVEQAAQIAGLADDVAEFPGGYGQLVGERGITLSGGQKQRTSIARAVMRQPRILILDDSLSAVDTYTEERILRNLTGVREGRTTLIVSHRISTIKDADLICVLDSGRIIERGTHDELLAHGGEYAALYERQLLEEEIEATD
jgi:ATP-binding cassette subfamily B protein